MDPGDVAVRDVGVDVARHQQRERRDEEVSADRQDHRGAQGEVPAPRLSQNEHERDGRRRDCGDRREHQRGSVQLVQTERVGQPAERPSRFHALGEHGMQRGTGHRCHERRRHDRDHEAGDRERRRS